VEWLAALEDWPVAVALRQSALLYPLVNAAHILGIGLLLGAIGTLDLRMLGMFRAAPLAVLAPPLRRVAASGLAVAMATGFLLFSTRPMGYLDNPAFLLKLALLGLGLLNVLALRWNRRWRLALVDGDAGAAPRGPALVSLLAWTGALLAGRWIGFL
jgi:hypothetical protein